VQENGGQTMKRFRIGYKNTPSTLYLTLTRCREKFGGHTSPERPLASRLSNLDPFVNHYLVLCNALCNYMCMATNLQIDDSLIQAALELGGHRTKRAVVEEALHEYVTRRKQLQIVAAFGTIDYEEDYDYKAQRKRE